MSNYQYQPYYNYEGPTLLDPFLEELPPDEVIHLLNSFFEKIGNYFEGVGAKIENIGNDTISITAKITQAECDAIVKKYLNEQLCAKKIPIWIFNQFNDFHWNHNTSKSCF